MEIGTHSQVPFLHLLRAISGSPVNAILRNRAGPQKEKDKTAPPGGPQCWNWDLRRHGPYLHFICIVLPLPSFLPSGRVRGCPA